MGYWRYVGTLGVLVMGAVVPSPGWPPGMGWDTGRCWGGHWGVSSMGAMRGQGAGGAQEGPSHVPHPLAPWQNQGLGCPGWEGGGPQRLMPPAGGGPQLLPHQDRLGGVGGDRSHAQGLPPPHPTPPSPDLFPMVEPILPSLQEEDGIVVWVLGAGPYPPGVVALQELLDEASEELEPEDVWQPEDMNDTCLYIFTSGTTGGDGADGTGTGAPQGAGPWGGGGGSAASSPLSPPGLPKAARISHLKSIMCLSFYELVGASSRDVVYLALPLYHMAGSLLGIVGCIGIGG